MFINGQWGTVCDDGWGINDAHVICRQLGYLGARRTHCCASYGQGVGPMLQLNCQGSEESFYECPQVVSPPGCGHHEDARVECYIDTGMRHSLSLLHASEFYQNPCNLMAHHCIFSIHNYKASQKYLQEIYSVAQYIISIIILC